VILSKLKNIKIMRMYFIPALFLVINTCLLVGCHSKEEQAVKVDSVKVTLQTVETVSRNQSLTYSGTIEADNTAQVGFAVPGTIDNVAVQEGQHVQKGQLLASIDATEYKNALAIADAGLEQAEDLYNRLDGLYKKGSLPAKDYIDIKTKVAQAKANKTINAKHIADSRLYAPMPGIITAKMIERGSTAAPGIPAFTIIKTDRVYAKASVPESEIGSLKTGIKATILIPTLNEKVIGIINIINPLADPVSKTYSVKIILNNSNGRLLPGMIANVAINSGKATHVIIIPATAVVRDADDLTYVFVAQGQKAVRKRITASGVTGANELLISDGLQAGDKIITAGQTRLKDGSSIEY
jgi:RND family efflux transporter MFP subunit